MSIKKKVISSALVVALTSQLNLASAHTFSHAVKEGETLSTIIWNYSNARLYGPNGNLQAIITKNPWLINPDLIYPGNVITLDIDSDKLLAEIDQSCKEHYSALSDKLRLERKIAQSSVFAQAKFVPKKLWGPFYFRRDQTFSAQLGGSFVTQKINNAEASNVAYSAKQQSMRLGLGYSKKSFVAEGSWIERVSSSGTGDFNPRWLRGKVGYGFDFDMGKSITSYILPLAGWDYYESSSSSSSTFIKGFSNPLVGFRSRFMIGKQWETGGDYLYTLIGNGQKHFVQGDLRYWLTPRWAFGLGYWVDIIKVNTSSTDFTERSYAAESYIRFQL